MALKRYIPTLSGKIWKKSAKKAKEGVPEEAVDGPRMMYVRRTFI